MASVYEAAKRCLQQQRHELAGSLLYLDAGAAEAVAAGVGLQALLELGPAGVCDLDAAAPADSTTAALLVGGPVRRVVFLVTSLLADAAAAVLAAAALHPATAQFTVLCSVSQAAHHDEVAGMYSSTCYAAFAAAWQQQLNEARRAAGRGPCSVAVLHSPLPLCPLTSAAFVLPPSAAAASAPRSAGLPAGCSAAWAAGGGGGDGSDSDDGVGGGGPTGLSLLAHALVDAAAALGHRPEAFSLGPCSRAVGRAMAFVPPQAEGAPPAALVLVDRALDPVSPSQHADLLVQRMCGALQHQLPEQPEQRPERQQQGQPLPEQRQQGLQPKQQQQQQQQQPGKAAAPHQQPAAPSVCPRVPLPSLDPPADGEPAGGGQGGGGRGAPSLLPGSLRHPGAAEAERWLEFLLSRQGRDGPLFVRKWLREACRKEGVAPASRFKPGSISAEELRALGDTLRRASAAAAARHAPLLQLAEAAAAALEGPFSEGWEARARHERALLFACGESREAAAAHLTELCQLAAGGGAGGAAPRPLGLADVALLAAAAYCWLPALLPWYAAGEGDAAPALLPQQEAELADALVEAVLASGTTDAPSGTAAGGADEAWALGRLCRRVAAARRALGAVERASPAGSAGDQGWSGDEGWESPEEELLSAAGDGGAAAGDADGGGGGAAAEQLPALRLEARDAALALLGRLRQLAAFRAAHLKAAKPLAAPGDDGAPRHTPLLAQLADAVLRDEPLPDLHAGATSLSGLLRSGLGRFGLQARPKPSDCPTVILFVLGGLSIAEVHAVLRVVDERAAAAQQPGGGAVGGPGAAPKPLPRVLVGATALLQPGELCGHLFGDL